ncbi:MAG: hypothetical protein NVS4B3_03490 [Gemmatimonadaceae bacterium]
MLHRLLRARYSNHKRLHMDAPHVATIKDAFSRTRLSLGAVLLVAGLFGHLFAAQAIGGSSMAYAHHIFGFFLLSVVSGAILLVLGWRFWRGRHDITMLILGASQALLGLVIYIRRFDIN